MIKKSELVNRLAIIAMLVVMSFSGMTQGEEWAGDCFLGLIPKKPQIFPVDKKPDVKAVTDYDLISGGDYRFLSPDAAINQEWVKARFWACAVQGQNLQIDFGGMAVVDVGQGHTMATDRYSWVKGAVGLSTRLTTPYSLKSRKKSRYELIADFGYGLSTGDSINYLKNGTYRANSEVDLFYTSLNGTWYTPDWQWESMAVFPRFSAFFEGWYPVSQSQTASWNSVPLLSADQDNRFWELSLDIDTLSIPIDYFTISPQFQVGFGRDYAGDIKTYFMKAGPGLRISLPSMISKKRDFNRPEDVNGKEIEIATISLNYLNQNEGNESGWPIIVVKVNIVNLLKFVTLSQ